MKHSCCCFFPLLFSLILRCNSKIVKVCKVAWKIAKKYNGLFLSFFLGVLQSGPGAYHCWRETCYQKQQLPLDLRTSEAQHHHVQMSNSVVDSFLAGTKCTALSCTNHVKNPCSLLLSCSHSLFVSHKILTDPQKNCSSPPNCTQKNCRSLDLDSVSLSMSQNKTQLFPIQVTLNPTSAPKALFLDLHKTWSS